MALINKYRAVLLVGVSMLLFLFFSSLSSAGFVEDFEDNNLDGWTGDLGWFETQSDIVTEGTYAANGTLDSSTNRFIYRNLTQNYSETNISFSLRGNIANTDVNTPTISFFNDGSLITAARISIFNSRIDVSDGDSMEKVADASADKWYNITLVINWAEYKIDKIYVNGTLMGANHSFRNNHNSLNRIGLELYGQNGASGYWDDILIGKSKQDISSSLVYPKNDTTFSTTEIYFNATYSSVNVNLTNATYYIWNSTGIFNNTEVFDISGNSNSSSKEIGGFIIGNYEWNSYVCGENSTSVICSWANTNNTFSMGARLTSMNYDNVTFETSRSQFNATFEVLSSSEINTAQLVYDGINYSISDLSYPNSTTLKLKKYIDIPPNPNYFQNDTNGFFFRFIYESDQEQGTSIRNQIVRWINLQICNSTYTNISLNFSYYDEVSGDKINASRNSTTIKSTFNYWLGNGGTYKNYSFESVDNSSNNNYQFCIYPATEEYKVNLDMDYSATDYSDNNYYLDNSTISSSIREIPLYLLLDDLATKFFVSVTQSLEEVKNAYVTISKYFTGEGLYKTVSIKETDDSGEFVGYFDIDEKYRFVVNHDGENLGTIKKTVTCDEAPCEFNLNFQEAVSDMWSVYYDIFATDVSYTLEYNDSSGIVTFDFTDNTGLAQYFRLIVTKSKFNESADVVCNSSLYTSSGTLDCNVSSYTGNFRATGYISRSPEKIVDYRNFVRETIRDILGDLGIFISFIFIIVIALAGAWNPAVGVAMTTLSVFGMWYLGFTAFSIVSVVLITGAAIILIAKMRM